MRSRKSEKEPVSPLKHRRTARDAMARCYDAVPCWIMPTWRVAESFRPILAPLIS